MILVLKMTKKYTQNMVLMSIYKGQLHGWKRANKFEQGPTPLFGQCPKENVFFLLTSSLTQFHLIPSSTKLYWPSITKNQPVPPHTDPAPPNTNQYRLLLTQYYHALTSPASYWPGNIIYQPVLPYTDKVPPSPTSTAFYWPRPTKYRSVLPCTDPVPSYINQYHPILTHYH